MGCGGNGFGVLWRMNGRTKLESLCALLLGSVVLSNNLISLELAHESVI